VEPFAEPRDTRKLGDKDQEAIERADPSAATDTVSRKTTWGHRRGAPPGGVPQGAGCRSLSRWEASRSSSSGIAPEGTPSRSVRHCRTTAVMTGSGCTASNM